MGGPHRARIAVARALHPGLRRAREAAGRAPQGVAVAATEADVAAKLIERLLVDPAFRARFRRNPAEACREAGLEELAQEMQLGAGKAMMTLDMRESRWALAGVMRGGARGGVGIMQSPEHAPPPPDATRGATGDLLSRVTLPGVGTLGGSLWAPPAPTAAPPA